MSLNVNNQQSVSSSNHSLKTPFTGQEKANNESLFTKASGGLLYNSEINEISNYLLNQGLDPASVAEKIKSVTVSPDGTIAIKTDNSTITYNEKNNNVSLTNDVQEANAAQNDEPGITYTTVDKEGNPNIDEALTKSATDIWLFGDPSQKIDGNVKADMKNNDDKIAKLAASLDGDSSTMSVAENTAFMMYQDSLGKFDGKVTADEINKSSNAVMTNPSSAKNSMLELYNSYKLSEKAKNLNISA